MELRDGKRSNYLHKSLEELRRLYVPVEIYVSTASKKCPLGAGTRVCFWVVGDGQRTMFYLSHGYPEIVRNKDFSFIKVCNVTNSMVVNGRIKYLPKMDEPIWVDLGPILPSALSDEDPCFESIRKSLLSDGDEDLDEGLRELRKAKREGKLDKIYEDDSLFD